MLMYTCSCYMQTTLEADLNEAKTTSVLRGGGGGGGVVVVFVRSHPTEVVCHRRVELAGFAGLSGCFSAV